MSSFKFAASQAKRIYLYTNLRAKVQRCCANVYFNQQCLKLGVIPKYAQINKQAPIHSILDFLNVF